MEEKQLRNLYSEFCLEQEASFLKDAKLWVGVSGIAPSRATLREVFQNYEKGSYLHFLKDVKDIIYGQNIFDFVVQNSTDRWILQSLVSFLIAKKMIRVSKKGKVTYIHTILKKVIPSPVTAQEARRRIEKKLGRKLNMDAPVSSVFGSEVVAEYDQLPISVSSALLLVEKILSYLPLKKKMLFVGDDDFMSVFLGLVDPSIESVVMDIDENLLMRIRTMATKHRLKLRTRKGDIRRKEKPRDRFVAFLVNPSYNLEGVKTFVEFGVSQLSSDGGFAFVEIGDESIGNRHLFLQKFFALRNLLVQEVVKGKIFYPWVRVHAEDDVLKERMESFVNKSTFMSSPRLGARLWIFEFIPRAIRKVKMKRSIYAYL